jgi:hypothetical protein
MLAAPVGSWLLCTAIPRTNLAVIACPRSPAGPARSLLTWARLPLPLLYEGGGFAYPLRQVALPGSARQLALNRCA